MSVLIRPRLLQVVKHYTRVAEQSVLCSTLINSSRSGQVDSNDVQRAPLFTVLLTEEIEHFKSAIETVDANSLRPT